MRYFIALVPIFISLLTNAVDAQQLSISQLSGLATFWQNLNSTQRQQLESFQNDTNLTVAQIQQNIDTFISSLPANLQVIYEKIKKIESGVSVGAHDQKTIFWQNDIFSNKFLRKNSLKTAIFDQK